MFRYFTNEEARKMAFWREHQAGFSGRQPL
jgi:hypothetical protein